MGTIIVFVSTGSTGCTVLLLQADRPSTVNSAVSIQLYVR